MVSLLLEGGGSRGVYTSGVLRYFMENNVQFPYVIGVSAGACSGSSYISNQIDRNHTVNVTYASHPEYLSLRNYVKNRQLFGMDFLFDRLPNELVPFNFGAYEDSSQEFVIVTTDVSTGEAVYYRKSHFPKDVLTLLRASSSLPLVAPAVSFQDRLLMDGGIVDPIPIAKSIQDGNKKHVVILTQKRGYFKKRQSFLWYIKSKYKHYPHLLRAIEKRHDVYNQSLQQLKTEEEKGNVLVISPSRDLDIGRVEKSVTKLQSVYDLGLKDAKGLHKKLEDFIAYS
ncbi:patatin-like phospholipase family protein [Geomicrobium sediminis]|uniref:Patatin/cPLA2 family phospholipase n=2 Tax=Geomicrobium TaxID=767528 RepID=A0ABS2PH21_9BACL|nr:patatin family protein [Geomicrobium sediminis]MBM7634108.1 putative patatin/cPLA2 family phospholipase [Geomicrobium sediminis]